jgi:hypothetical protein
MDIMFIVLLGAAAAAVAVLLAVGWATPPPEVNATFETADASPPKKTAEPKVKPSLPPRRSIRLLERSQNIMAERRSARLSARPRISYEESSDREY